MGLIAEFFVGVLCLFITRYKSDNYDMLEELQNLCDGEILKLFVEAPGLWITRLKEYTTKKIYKCTVARHNYVNNISDNYDKLMEELQNLCDRWGKLIFMLRQREMQLMPTWKRWLTRLFAREKKIKGEAHCDREEELISMRSENEMRSEIEKQLMHRCKTCYTRVGKIKKEVEELKNKYQNRSPRKFLLKLFPAPKLVKLSKRIVKKTNEIGCLTIEVEGIITTVQKELKEEQEKKQALTLGQMKQLYHKIMRKFFKKNISD